MDRLDFIDTRFGTANSYRMSQGNCLPLTGTPFAMNYISVQSRNEDSSWWFHPEDHSFVGLRLTHQPSPWIGDFSTFTCLPISGAITIGDVFHNQWSYRPKEATFQPHQIQLASPGRGLTVQATASTYAFHYAFSFEYGGAGIILHHPGASAWQVSSDGKTLHGYVKNQSDCEDKDLKMYVTIHLSQPILERKIGKELETCALNDSHEESFFYFAFDKDIKEIEVSGATSFISHKQALINYQAEGKLTFEEAIKKNLSTWLSYLDRIEVTNQEKEKEHLFYQHFYRALLFPQRWYEIDDTNHAIHYNTLTKSEAKGKLYTNNGFWDTSKTLYPFLSLTAPEIYEEVLEGLVSSYKDTGYLPKWLSPDERGMMPGTLADAVIADGAVKGFAKKHLPVLLEAMLTTAKNEKEDKKYGRLASKEYESLGYIPNSYHESVNQTLDYSYSDFCIGQVAGLLGRKALAAHYHYQSLNYRQLIDSEHTCLRGKDKNGHFASDFQPTKWGGDYTEGSSFQNSWGVYHDFLGLIKAIGGKAIFAKKLEELCNTEPNFLVGSYGFEIHEMSELAAQDFGQIAISNQPSFHLPYLYYFIGKPAYGQLIIKNLLNYAFTKTAYPGDEDNGSMSSWYLLNSMGLYPLTPGSGQYLLGIPNLDKISLHLPNQKDLVICCQNNHPQYQFVTEVSFNQEKASKLYINHRDLLKGGKLTFKLGLVPPSHSLKQADLPFSLTK